jgi:hypothetical protein
MGRAAPVRRINSLPMPIDIAEIFAFAALLPPSLPPPAIAMRPCSLRRTHRTREVEGGGSVTNRVQKRAVVVVALAGLLVWATWPAAGQLNVETCSPNGLFAKLSAAFHGNTFWSVQLADLGDRRRRAENWDQFQADMQARSNAVVEKSEEFLKQIYQAQPSLAPTDAQIAAKQLRDLADKIEADEATRTVSEYMQKLLVSKLRRDCSGCRSLHHDQSQIVVAVSEQLRRASNRCRAQRGCRDTKVGQCNRRRTTPIPIPG